MAQAVMALHINPGLTKMVLARMLVPGDPGNHGLRVIARCIDHGLVRVSKTTAEGQHLRLTALGSKAARARLAA